METLETSRLVLRPFTTDDFEAVQAYAGDLDNVKFMEWGPNAPEHTRYFIQMAIDKAGDVPCRDYQYAVVLKETGGVIGGCSLTLGSRSDASLGWILHKSHWKKGYGTELGKCLLSLAFAGLGLHRVTARCNADNYGSYRVMERIGLRREGLFIESGPPNKLTNEKYGNEYMYGILKQEWDTRLASDTSQVNIPTLAGSTITLRAVRESDIDDRFLTGRHHDYIHMCGGDSLTGTEYPERAVWEAWYRRTRAEENTWIIDLDGKCIGTARLYNLSAQDRSATYAVGIFDPAYYDKGIGSEATRLILQYGFEELKLHRIVLKVLEYNKRAIRCYEKCGFQTEGMLRDSAWIDGQFSSDLMMSILEDEWRALCD